LAEEAIIHFDQSADAGRFIQDRMHPGDVVLIKGSQGARMERITKELMDHPEKAEQLIVRQTPDWLAKA
jgi:UDP-N-acetylmuramyl pentapeptide synthase